MYDDRTGVVVAVVESSAFFASLTTVGTAATALSLIRRQQCQRWRRQRRQRRIKGALRLKPFIHSMVLVAVYLFYYIFDNVESEHGTLIVQH